MILCTVQVYIARLRAYCNLCRSIYVHFSQ